MHLEGSKHKQWTYMQAETLLGGICSCFFFFFWIVSHWGLSPGACQCAHPVLNVELVCSRSPPHQGLAEAVMGSCMEAALVFVSAQPQEDVRVLRGFGSCSRAGLRVTWQGLRAGGFGQGLQLLHKKMWYAQGQALWARGEGECSQVLRNVRKWKLWKSTAVLYGMHVSMHHMRWERECRAVQSLSVPAYLSNPISASGLPQDWSPGKHGHLCGRGQAPETWADVLRHSPPGTTQSCLEPGEGVRGPCISTQVAPMQPPIITAGTLCLFLAYSLCITKVKK